MYFQLQIGYALVPEGEVKPPTDYQSVSVHFEGSSSPAPTRSLEAREIHSSTHGDGLHNISSVERVVDRRSRLPRESCRQTVTSGPFLLLVLLLVFLIIWILFP